MKYINYNKFLFLLYKSYKYSKLIRYVLNNTIFIVIILNKVLIKI